MSPGTNYHSPGACSKHQKSTIRGQGFACDDCLLDDLRRRGILDLIRDRIMTVVTRRDVEPMGDFEDCINEALELEPRKVKP